MQKARDFNYTQTLWEKLEKAGRSKTVQLSKVQCNFHKTQTILHGKASAF